MGKKVLFCGKKIFLNEYRHFYYLLYKDLNFLTVLIINN